MGLDASLRQQLIEAQKRILAQLEEMRFRSIAGNPHGGGGPPDYDSVAAELQDELREINRLLGPDANDARPSAPSHPSIAKGS